MLEPGTLLQTLCEGVEVSSKLVAKMNRIGPGDCVLHRSELANELVGSLPNLAEHKHAELLIRLAAKGSERSEAGLKPHPVPTFLTDILRGVHENGGPGTELRKLLSWFAKHRKGCRCKERALIMDRWGPRQTRRNIDTVVAWLKEEAAIRFPGGHELIPVIAYKTAIWKACDLAEGRENNEDISMLTNADIPGLDDDTLVGEWPFVWTNYMAGAVGDELKYSIRSVLHHWPKARVVIVGDKPDWYTGEMVDLDRIPKTDFHAFKDCYTKVLHMTTLLPQFIWMMDDIYFLKRVPMMDVVAPKYVRHVSQQKFNRWKPKNKWGRTRQLAYRWLLDRNRPTYDFASHLPQPIQSASFKEMNQEARILQEYKNWECVYFNSYRSADAQDWGRRFTRVTKPRESLVTDKAVLNHTHASWNGGVQKHLADMFPNKSRVEA